jgi:hypothetical protein
MSRDAQRRERQAESESLERALRCILRMFADGNLAYRARVIVQPFDVRSRALSLRGARAKAS